MEWLGEGAMVEREEGKVSLDTNGDPRGKQFYGLTETRSGKHSAIIQADDMDGY